MDDIQQLFNTVIESFSLTEKRLNERLDSIDKKLDNHIVHMSADLSMIKSDVQWLTKLRDEQCEKNRQNIQRDEVLKDRVIEEEKAGAKRQTHLDLLMKIFFILATSLISLLVGRYIL